MKNKYINPTTDTISVRYAQRLATVSNPSIDSSGNEVDTSNYQTNGDASEAASRGNRLWGDDE